MFPFKFALREALAVMMAAHVTVRSASDPSTNSIGIRLIPVKAGSFTMGSATRDDNWNERPVHTVTISEEFLLSETEVTLEQFRKFRPDFECTPGCDPYVAGVSWIDATAFCDWLSGKEGRPYRLPTEAEWEYACRAGTETPFSSGTLPPAPETANAWGLKNMHTGVREWCFDRYGEYPLEAEIDPAGPNQGNTRVFRGGGMDENKPEYARSAARGSMGERFGIGVAENADQRLKNMTNTLLSGMVGRFFGEPDLTRPHDKFVIHKLDLSKKEGAFDKGSGWSGRFLGFIEAPFSGAVAFEGIADDGMDVIVEGKKIINAWNQRGKAVAGTVDMVKGRKYEVEITYTQNGGDAFMRLYWSWAGQEKQIVPSTAVSYNGIQEMKVVAMGTGATSELPGHHLIGFRVVQAAPATRFRKAEAPYASQGVRQDISLARQGPDPAKPYFRKRFMMPTPPENSDRKVIDAAGLHPSFREHNHSPALEALPNGDVLLVIYTSYNEYEPGVSLIAARLRFGAEEWDMPSPWVDFALVNDHAPLLWVDQGVLRLFWGNPRLASAFPFQWLESIDNGATLGPVTFPRFTSPIGPHSKQPINAAFRGKDGTMYIASDAEGASSVLWASRDNGKTWYDTGGRSAGRHTTYAPLKHGTILGMGGKNSNIEGYMPKVVSRDGGKTWEKSKTPFAALAANQRPSLLRLASGRLFFAGDFQDFGGKQPDGIRERGSYVALSEDDGLTWTIKPLLGAQPHENGRLNSATIGYSAARQAPNGVIHLITTMNRPNLHFELNEAWIRDGNATREDPMATTAIGPLADVKQLEERYPDGRSRLTWNVGLGSDGRYLLQGSEIWYYENGQKQREANYEKGSKTGAEKYWSREGKLAWIWDYRPDGSAVWSQFWSNGQKKSVSTWRNFMCDGIATCWDPFGKQISQVVFSGGMVKK
jgi:hypothetical protein